ncbi:MAG: diguanylate cyclase [Sphaerochaeta sp.]|nr:diguanylate cyclase [Sphaerochaeta sp.]
MINKRGFAKRVISWLRLQLGLVSIDEDVLISINDANFLKLPIITLVGGLMMLSYSVIFHYFIETRSSSEEFWRRGVEITHITLTLILLAISFLSWVQIQKRTGKRSAYEMTLQLMVIASALISSTILATLDQIVTASITPFLIACIIIALLFELRPILAVVIFSLGYLLFFSLIGMYQENPSVTLSNRINSLAAVGLGYILSFVFWKIVVRNNLQSKYISQQQEELQRINKKLEILASSDGLTGLQNRRMLDSRLDEVLQACEEAKVPFSIILFDLDRFKEYNDFYGHVAGDDCLKIMATMLVESMRFDGDTAFRYGGEEFVLLLPNISAEEAFATAEMVRQGVLDLQIVHSGNSAAPFVSASFGVLTLTVVTNFMNADVLSRVDTLLYRAKAQGRNCSVQGVE